MRRPSGLVVFALVACLAASALADDLLLSDGTSHTCEILSVDEKGVLARGKMKSGEPIELKVPVARLDPSWFYARLDPVLGTDAQARVRLAAWCAEHSMFSQARIQMRKAVEADPKLLDDIATGKYDEIRERVATRVLAAAEADVAAGRLDAASEKLEVLLGRLSDTDAGEKARDTLRAVAAKQSEAEAKKEATANAKLEEKRTKLLASPDEDYAKGREMALEGLTEDNVGKALDLIEKALGRGESALKKLDAIEKENASDAVLVAAVKERRVKTTTGMVKCRIHRADLYIWRGSLPNAMEELAAARKLDPTNTAIDSAMERLLAADQDDPFERRLRPEQRASGMRFGRGGARGGGGRGR